MDAATEFYSIWVPNRSVRNGEKLQLWSKLFWKYSVEKIIIRTDGKNRRNGRDKFTTVENNERCIENKNQRSRWFKKENQKIGRCEFNIGREAKKYARDISAIE